MPTIKGVAIGPQGGSFPDSCFGDGFIAAPNNGSQAIDGSKVKHQYPLQKEVAGPAVTITTTTVPLGFVRKASVLQDYLAMITGVLPSGDHTVTIKLQRAPAGSLTFADMLTTPIVLDSTATIATLQSQAFTSTSLAAGDRLQAVVTAAGSTGSQGQGLQLGAWLMENPF